ARPIMTMDDLPLAWKTLLAKPAVEKRPSVIAAKQQAGHWPDFALAMASAVKIDARTHRPPLGPCKPADFASETHDYLVKRLPKLIPESEQTALASVEGSWPAYPEHLHQLARRYSLSIPGITLPGPPELWEGARGPQP